MYPLRTVNRVVFRSGVLRKKGKIVKAVEAIENLDKVVFDEGIDVQTLRTYGIGIDTHSKFIHVCVMVHDGASVKKYEHPFNTTWNQLVMARNWAEDILRTKSNPPLTEADIQEFRYTIESTGCYHFPVLKALQGTPAIINPLLASPSRRKTDALDARLLCYQNMTGLWPESFQYSDEVCELRVMVNERIKKQALRTNTGNRANNYILRFGYTYGQVGNVLGDKETRKLTDKLMHGEVLELETQIGVPLPPYAQEIMRNLAETYDRLNIEIADLEDRIFDRICGLTWNTEKGPIDGKTFVKNLMTVPGVGKWTACMWCAYIVDVMRFPNKKAIAAYCGLDPSLKISAGKVTSTVKRGGRKELHKVLLSAGGSVMRKKGDFYGQWGYDIYTRTGSWKKAANAVARRVCVALYYVSRRAEPFTYEQYRFYERPTLPDLPLEAVWTLEPRLKRFKGLVEETGIETLQQLYNGCKDGWLTKNKGLGKTFYNLVLELSNNIEAKLKEWDGEIK